MCEFGFGNSSEQLSNMVVLVYSHEQCMSSSCSTSSSRGCSFIPFPSSHSGGCELVPHCVLICEHLIIRAIFVSMNVKFLCKSFAHSDQISRSVMSDSLRPHESQHPRSPCPSPTPGVHPDSRPLSQ